MSTTLKMAAFNKRQDLEMLDWKVICDRDMPHGEAPARRMNYASIATAVMAVLSFVGWLYGAGVFDRFITR